MTSTAPTLDWLFLKMEDTDGIYSMPLCEVVEGDYKRDGDTHLLTVKDNVAAFSQLKFSQFLELQFAYLGKIQYWIIQPAGEEQSPVLKGFIEKFAGKK
jgi:hypothetical protein